MSGSQSLRNPIRLAPYIPISYNYHCRMFKVTNCPCMFSQSSYCTAQCVGCYGVCSNSRRVGVYVSKHSVWAVPRIAPLSIIHRKSLNHHRHGEINFIVSRPVFKGSFKRFAHLVIFVSPIDRYILADLGLLTFDESKPAQPSDIVPVLSHDDLLRFTWCARDGNPVPQNLPLMVESEKARGGGVLCGGAKCVLRTEEQKRNAMDERMVVKRNMLVDKDRKNDEERRRRRSEIEEEENGDDDLQKKKKTKHRKHYVQLIQRLSSMTQSEQVALETLLVLSV